MFCRLFFFILSISGVFIHESVSPLQAGPVLVLGRRTQRETNSLNERDCFVQQWAKNRPTQKAKKRHQPRLSLRAPARGTSKPKCSLTSETRSNAHNRMEQIKICFFHFHSLVSDKHPFFSPSLVPLKCF